MTDEKKTLREQLGLDKLPPVQSRVVRESITAKMANDAAEFETDANGRRVRRKPVKP
jgi:hypothetical protein